MPFRWGIIGLGKIARKFAIGLQSLPSAELVAVGSRSREKAEAFGAEFDVAGRYGTYADLAANPNVDAVYVATPHPMHCEDTLTCLAAGKAVLCEKPFAINATQSRTMIDESRARHVFLMEAMWTRFFPLMDKLRRLVAAGDIGEIRMVCADFGYRAPFDPANRLFDPSLGGGALLDVGIYPVSLASMLLGAPVEIHSTATLGSTGVDEEASILMRHAAGAVAMLSTATRLDTQREAIILGTEGSVRIPQPWWQPRSMTVTRGDSVEKIETAFNGNGYEFEAAEVERCIAAGKIASDIMPQAETLRIMETLDTIRAQWGLRYPSERAV